MEVPTRGSELLAKTQDAFLLLTLDGLPMVTNGRMTLLVTREQTNARRGPTYISKKRKVHRKVHTNKHEINIRHISRALFYSAIQGPDLQQHLWPGTVLVYSGIGDGARVPDDRLVRQLEREYRQEGGQQDLCSNSGDQ